MAKEKLINMVVDQGCNIHPLIYNIHLSILLLIKIQFIIYIYIYIYVYIVLRNDILEK